MTIEQLAGFDVKVSANTLTAKNENGKTAGLVRGVRLFANAPIKDQVNASEKVKKLAKQAGKDFSRSFLFGAKLFMCGNDLFVLTKTETETTKFYQAIGVPVIPVKSVK